ncbi:single-stranded DNA-binding protein [candidate division WOR-3 bacterium]|uniref:Single-stranded DNA-binding protein n=1 Tax=candidate division WOR-3 bacterium TaxID=2052148 RepID=A0A9D5K885_UNCW3|nr:single-stranded DNA-binding protein [candidate division WOR-3 bacterium]MBD3363589.1 single-stranded DNA-binding protein [candidate division WOR-3 bacterium]
MPNLNYVLLSGRLVADPELRYTPKGTAVCSFRVAVNKRYKDRDTGEWKEDANFFSIVVWDRMAEMAGERLKKGSPVVVEGNLRSRSYEAQDGNRRYVVEIVSRRLQFLEKAPSTGDYSPEGAGQSDKGLEDDPFEN